MAELASTTSNKELPIIKPFTERQLLSLYHNSLLNEVSVETESFLEKENNLYFENSPLKNLLYEYTKSRTALKASERLLEKLKEGLEEQEKAIWTLEQSQVENHGVCHDKVKVVSVCKFQVARHNAGAENSCCKTMREMREELFENHSLCLYKTTKLKMRIDDFINKACGGIAENREVVITNISVLFNYQRKLNANDDCIRDSRAWLDRLVAVLLQNGPTFKDHLFLLNHILRCPGGVGHWSAQYVQIPSPIFVEDEDYLNNESLNLMVALLSVLFSPVEGRVDMLRDFCLTAAQTKTNSDSPNWVSVDSDGEDDEGRFLSEAPLRENDFVSLLNQFPFEALFKYLMKIGPTTHYDPGRFSTNSFFKLFAFGTQFVNLLKTGLQNFSSPAYRQLSKRLGRLIKHTLQCITDHWLCYFYMNQAHPDEMAMVGRIEVEYNNFFLRAVISIFRSSANAGMWQYLAVVPYSSIRENFLWYAYAMFHFMDLSDIETLRQDPSFSKMVFERMSDAKFRASFEDTLSGLPDTEIMFLLTTFANMAIARDFELSKQFVCTVVTELVGIGFLNKLTSDMSSKGCKDLLANISSKHPQVLSHLLHYFSEEPLLVEDSDIALYICRDLVFHSWFPTDADFDLLDSWLTKKALATNFSQLSRMIFSKMNWNSLPWERHKILSLSVVEASLRFAPDSIAGNFLHDSMRQVSNLAGKFRRSPELIFTSWAWEMCSRLKLHRFDQSDSRQSFVDLELDAEVLGRAVATKNPLGCYVALQLCQPGHLIEDFLDRGLNFLAIVLSSGHYDHVLECLVNITPLAFNQPSMLCDNEDFIKVMHQVISIDHTYLKMAKDLVVSDFPGPVLKEFVNMLSYQLDSKEALYDIRSAHSIIAFWTRVMVQIPNWMNTRSSLFILEHLCKACDPIGIIELKRTIQDFDQKMLAPSTGGFLSWLSVSKATTTSLTSVMQEFPWTSFYVLEVEEQREEVVRFWKALVEKLSDGCVSVEKCQKDIMNEAHFPEYATNINALPIYKWCQMILDCPQDEPMQVAFAQKFFKYFTASSANDKPKVGRFFFEGMINAHYFGRVVAKFKVIEDHYTKEGNALANVFCAFGLWLKDMLILDEKLHVPTLSPQMCPDLLSEILDSSKGVNLSMVANEEFSAMLKQGRSEWMRLHFRPNKLALDHALDSKEECKVGPDMTLGSFDNPTPLLLQNSLQTSIRHISDAWFVSPIAFEPLVSPLIDALREYGTKFDELKREFGSLMCSYKELVGGLYVNVKTEQWTKGSCMGTTGPKGQKYECAGSAAICHKFSQAQLQEVVDQKIKSNKDALSKVLANAVQPIQTPIISAFVLLEDVVEYLMKMYFRHLSLSPGRGPTQSLMHYRQMGVMLFYLLVDCLGEETSVCPPLLNLLTISFEKLGQAVISEHPDQCLPLLQRICSKPDLASILSPIFTPGCSDAPTFLKMYHMISGMTDENSCLAFTLLSKMNVDAWATKATEKETSQLIACLGEAFQRTGPKVDAKRQMIHDLHRTHLSMMFLHNFPEHLQQIVHFLLVQTESAVLDPNVWVDLVNSLLPKDTVRPQTCPSAWEALLKSALINENGSLIGVEEVQMLHMMLSTHFNHERRTVGLHGLYSKYKNYTVPLAAIMCLDVGCYVKLLSNNAENIKHLFDWTSYVFEPWLIPLSDVQRQETAAWIQQFAESTKVMFPWAPGDVKAVTPMLVAYSNCVTYIDQKLPTSERSALSHLLELYCLKFANPAIKDFILAPIHTHWLSLEWSKFVPKEEDMNRLATVLDTFIPLCHEFLGRVFVKFPWDTILGSPYNVQSIAPNILHVIVKLSSEPQIRQSNELMKLINIEITDEMWPKISASRYESLMHWYIMSVDPKVALEADDNHLLDARVFQILRIGSGIDPNASDGRPECVRKTKVYIMCVVKLFSACGCKHKNYLTLHEKELEKAIHKLVDDIGDFAIRSEINDCEDMVKAVMGLMNSPSPIMPKIVLSSISESWLRMVDHSKAAFFIGKLLKHVSTLIASPSWISDVIEVSLEAHFYENDSSSPKWNEILPLMQLPTDKEKYQQCLQRAVSEGHCLLLFAAMRISRSKCSSIVEERALMSTLLDYFRHFELSEKSEPKIALLFRETIALCERQIACGTPEPVVAKCLLDFIEVLAPLVGLEGRTWDFLGALGLSSKFTSPPRAKFLAMALIFFIHKHLLQGPRIRLKSVEVPEKEEAGYLFPEKVSKLEEEIKGLLQKPSYFGLSELIEWVLMVMNSASSFEDAEKFLSFIICDNLYTERYHHIQ